MLGAIFTDHYLELQAASNQQYQSGANDAETTFMCVAVIKYDNCI